MMIIAGKIVSYNTHPAHTVTQPMSNTCPILQKDFHILLFSQQIFCRNVFVLDTSLVNKLFLCMFGNAVLLWFNIPAFNNFICLVSLLY